MTTSPAVWFAPAAASTMLTDMETAPAAFQAEMSHVSGVALYEVALTAPDAELQTFFSYLDAHNITLGIEAMPLVATVGQPGYGVESFSEHATDLSGLLTKAKNDGAVVSYVAWDEPFTYGHQTGYLTLQQTAAQVAAAGVTVTSIFPDAVIGDIEPIGPPEPGSTTTALSNMTEWFTAYQAASGSQFAFLVEDIPAASPGWETAVEQVTAAFQAKGTVVVAIVDGWYNATSNNQWESEAEATAQALMAMTGAVPNVLLVQTWNPYPSEVDNPAISGSLANTLLETENLDS